MDGYRRNDYGEEDAEYGVPSAAKRRDLWRGLPKPTRNGMTEDELLRRPGEVALRAYAMGDAVVSAEGLLHAPPPGGPPRHIRDKYARDTEERRSRGLPPAFNPNDPLDGWDARVGAYDPNAALLGARRPHIYDCGPEIKDNRSFAQKIPPEYHWDPRVRDAAHARSAHRKAVVVDRDARTKLHVAENALSEARSRVDDLPPLPRGRRPNAAARDEAFSALEAAKTEVANARAVAAAARVDNRPSLPAGRRGHLLAQEREDNRRVEAAADWGSVHVPPDRGPLPPPGHPWPPFGGRVSDGMYRANIGPGVGDLRPGGGFSEGTGSVTLDTGNPDGWVAVSPFDNRRVGSFRHAGTDGRGGSLWHFVKDSRQSPTTNVTNVMSRDSAEPTSKPSYIGYRYDGEAGVLQYVGKSPMGGNRWTSVAVGVANDVSSAFESAIAGARARVAGATPEEARVIEGEISALEREKKASEKAFRVGAGRPEGPEGNRSAARGRPVMGDREAAFRKEESEWKANEDEKWKENRARVKARAKEREAASAMADLPGPMDHAREMAFRDAEDARWAAGKEKRLADAAELAREVSGESERERTAANKAARLAKEADKAADEADGAERARLSEALEASRVEAVRVEAARMERLVEADRARADGAERARLSEALEASKVEAARVEAARMERLVEADRARAARDAGLAREAKNAKDLASAMEASKVEAVRVEAARMEARRTENAKATEAGRDDFERRGKDLNNVEAQIRADEDALANEMELTEVHRAQSTRIRENKDREIEMERFHRKANEERVTLERLAGARETKVTLPGELHSQRVTHTPLVVGPVADAMENFKKALEKRKKKAAAPQQRRVHGRELAQQAAFTTRGEQPGTSSHSAVEVYGKGDKLVIADPGTATAAGRVNRPGVPMVFHHGREEAQQTEFVTTPGQPAEASSTHNAVEVHGPGDKLVTMSTKTGRVVGMVNDAGIPILALPTAPVVAPVVAAPEAPTAQSTLPSVARAMESARTAMELRRNPKPAPPKVVPPKPAPRRVVIPKVVVTPPEMVIPRVVVTPPEMVIPKVVVTPPEMVIPRVVVTPPEMVIPKVVVTPPEVVVPKRAPPKRALGTRGKLRIIRGRPRHTGQEGQQDPPPDPRPGPRPDPRPGPQGPLDQGGWDWLRHLGGLGPGPPGDPEDQRVAVGVQEEDQLVAAGVQEDQRVAVGVQEGVPVGPGRPEVLRLSRRQPEEEEVFLPVHPSLAGRGEVLVREKGGDDGDGDDDNGAPNQRGMRDRELSGAQGISDALGGGEPGGSDPEGSGSEGSGSALVGSNHMDSGVLEYVEENRVIDGMVNDNSRSELQDMIANIDDRISDDLAASELSVLAGKRRTLETALNRHESIYGIPEEEEEEGIWDRRKSQSGSGEGGSGNVDLSHEYDEDFGGPERPEKIHLERMKDTVESMYGKERNAKRLIGRRFMLRSKLKSIGPDGDPMKFIDAYAELQGLEGLNVDEYTASTTWTAEDAIREKEQLEADREALLGIHVEQEEAIEEEREAELVVAEKEDERTMERIKRFLKKNTVFVGISGLALTIAGLVVGIVAGVRKSSYVAAKVVRSAAYLARKAIYNLGTWARPIGDIVFTVMMLLSRALEFAGTHLALALVGVAIALAMKTGA